MHEIKARRSLHDDHGVYASREELSDSEPRSDEYFDEGESHSLTSPNSTQFSEQSRSSLHSSKETPKPLSSTSSIPTTKGKLYKICPILVLVFSIISSYLLYDKLNNFIGPDHSCTFTTSLQDGTKLSIQSAVHEVKHNHLSVLLFIHSPRTTTPKSISEHTNNFNVSIQSIINYSACELNNNGEYVELTSDVLNSKDILADRGRIITQFMPQLQTKHILIVRRLQDVPSEIAPLFHLICDRFTPVVNKLLVVFTLEHENSKRFANMSDFNIVEQVLMDSWSEKIGSDNFGPLIARMTAEIIRL